MNVQSLNEMVMRMLDESGALRPNADLAKTAQRFAMLAGEIPVKFRDTMMFLGVATGAVLMALYKHGVDTQLAQAQAANWGNSVFKIMTDEDHAYIAQIQKGQSQ
jgi:hypothetical protein